MSGEISIGDIIELRDGREVRVTKLRSSKYAFPIWFEDIKTSMPDGCKFEDLI